MIEEIEIIDLNLKYEKFRLRSKKIRPVRTIMTLNN